jgi:hypothetical protein
LNIFYIDYQWFKLIFECSRMQPDAAGCSDEKLETSVLTNRWPMFADNKSTGPMKTGDEARRSSSGSMMGAHASLGSPGWM